MLAPSLNRVLRIVTATDGEGGEMRAALEDDFHHFRIGARYRNDVITSVDYEAVRTPFDLCGLAGRRLDDFVGMVITADYIDAIRHSDQFSQCTHQFDLMILAICAAARKIPARTYYARVDDPVDGVSKATLTRDSAPCLTWEIERGTIADPPQFSGRGIGAGFTSWVCTSFNKDDAEAALVLRRAVFIAQARRFINTPPPQLPIPNGGCWVKQPDRAHLANRSPDWRIDFSGREQALTADDDAWLRVSLKSA